jgi:hypothetical protein
LKPFSFKQNLLEIKGQLDEAEWYVSQSLGKGKMERIQRNKLAAET